MAAVAPSECGGDQEVLLRLESRHGVGFGEKSRGDDSPACLRT